MTKRTITTEEPFNKIRTILKEKNRLPDTFSYKLSAKSTEQKEAR